MVEDLEDADEAAVQFDRHLEFRVDNFWDNFITRLDLGQVLGQILGQDLITRNAYARRFYARNCLLI